MLGERSTSEMEAKVDHKLDAHCNKFIKMMTETEPKWDGRLVA